MNAAASYPSWEHICCKNFWSTLSHTQHGSRNSPEFSINDAKVSFTASSKFSTDIYPKSEHTSLLSAFTSVN